MSSLKDLEIGYVSFLLESKRDFPPAVLLGQLTSLSNFTLHDLGCALTSAKPLSVVNDLLSSPPPSFKRIQLGLSLTTYWPKGARAELESKAEAAGIWVVFVI